MALPLTFAERVPVKFCGSSTCTLVLTLDWRATLKRKRSFLPHRPEIAAMAPTSSNKRKSGASGNKTNSKRKVVGKVLKEAKLGEGDVIQRTFESIIQCALHYNRYQRFLCQRFNTISLCSGVTPFMRCMWCKMLDVLNCRLILKRVFGSRPWWPECFWLGSPESYQLSSILMLFFCVDWHSHSSAPEYDRTSLDESSWIHSLSSSKLQASLGSVHKK